MNENEIAEYDRQAGDDWAEYRAEDEAITRALEYAAEGRLD
jgi:hypothetical protein